MTILPVHDNSNDIIIYLDTRSGSSFDILESTAWIREVVVQSQKRRKGCHFDHHYHHHHRHLDYYHHHYFQICHYSQGLGSFAVSVFLLLASGKGLRRFTKSLLVIIIIIIIIIKEMWVTRMSKMLNVHLDQFYNK